jgi:hypothetical protein
MLYKRQCGVWRLRARVNYPFFSFFHLLASCVLHFIHVLRLRRDCDFHFDSDLGLIDGIASID